MASHFNNQNNTEEPQNDAPVTRFATDDVRTFSDDDAQPLPDAAVGSFGGGATHMKSAYDQHQHVDADAMRKRGRVRASRIALGIIAAFLVVVVGGIAFYIHMLNEQLAFKDKKEGVELKEALASADDTDESNAYYVLLVGSDSRGGLNEKGRGDVTMLARVAPSDGEVTLVSIPRDTMVNIEHYGTVKINAAYAYGGASLAVKTVSAFAGVPISHYAEIDFDGLTEVVDELGGVTVNIPEAFSAGGFSFDAGEQTLNGEQALVYARERHSFSGGDFTRAQSQRQVVEAIIHKVMAQPATEYPKLFSQLAQSVSTDYSVPDLVGLAMDFQGKDPTIYSAICPSYAHNVDGVSYVATMYREWQDMMRRVDAGLDPDDVNATIPEKQAGNADLGSASNGAGPRDYEALAADSLNTGDVNTAS